MQRLLLARECGDEAHGLDDMLSAQWADLVVDDSRKYNVQYCSSLSFIDVDRPRGSLLLCGGHTSSSYGNPRAACVGVLRYIEPGSEMGEHHLECYLRERPPGPLSFSCGRWFPHDSAIFVTGSSDYGEVIIWDTERFTPVTSFELSTEARVIATEMSYAPGAKTELIAVGRNDSSDLTLVDMGSGAATHRLDAHDFTVTDVTWAPINPHLVASVDMGGIAFLFDIRRSGKTACLVRFDDSRRIPTFEVARSKRTSLAGGDMYNRSYDTAGLEREHLLGLGCVWNDNFERRPNKKRHRTGNARSLVSQGPPLNRARFTPDGCSLITADWEGMLRVWDVFTGRLIKTHNSLASLPAGTQPNWRSTFEISRDGLHILCHSDRRLMTLDVEEGFVVGCSGSVDVYGITDLVLHPVREEALSVEGDTIVSWSSRARLRSYGRV